MSTLPPALVPPHSDPAFAVFIAKLQEQIDAQAREIELGAHNLEVSTHTLEVSVRELEYARLRIQVLEQHLRLRRIAKYGPASERLSNLQLELLEEEPAVSAEEVDAESQREALPAPGAAKKRKKHPGRQILPANLERVGKIIACAPDQRVCKGCGKETAVIGYDESEVLDVEPARYFVQVTKREKRACKHCEERGVMAAPLAARIIEKSLASDRIIIDTIVNKYTAHLPLYRQSALLERDCGVEIGRATMCGWVMTVGAMLTPLVGAMRKELLAGTYIQADETPVDVQTHDKRGGNHQAYLWQYGTPGGAAVFDFRMSRAREGPARFLEKFEGILQTDGYAAYDHGVGGPGMVHAACWSHARRHFVDAVKLNKQDAASARAVELMDALFAIDREAREENLDHAARHRLRQEKAPPLLEQIRTHILATNKSALPRSKAGQACGYTLALWERLTRFLDHPQLELSNNRAENSMRPVATGRKNWIHIGGRDAGPRVAAILSVIESCRRLNIPVRRYLAEILPGLADRPVQSLAGITPTAWAAAHPQS